MSGKFGTFVDEERAPQEPEAPRPPFISTFFGVLLQPLETLDELFVTSRPPHTVALFTLFVAAFFGPMILPLLRYRGEVFLPEYVLTAVVISSVTIVVFSFIESGFLRILGVALSLERLFASICYALVPAIFGIFAIHLVGYLAFERLNVIPLLMVGALPIHPRFFEALPYVVGIIQVHVLIVFWGALRAAAELGTVLSLILSFLSLIPFYLSVLVGLLVAEMIRPGALETVHQVIAGL